MFFHCFRTWVGGMLLLAQGAWLLAQGLPAPARPQTEPVIIRNATLHWGNGQPAQVGDLLLLGGKITEAGKVESTFKQAREIDGTGKHVYPGFIAMNTTLGLQEIEAVRASQDHREVGDLNAGARAIVAYNAESVAIPPTRSNGVLLAQLAPQGGLFPGTSAAVQLDAWGWDDAALSPEEGVFINVPNLAVSSDRNAPPADKQRRDIAQRMAQITQSIEEAMAYAQMPRPTYNSHLEALAAALQGHRTVYFRANSEQEILFAIEATARFKLRSVVVGGAEAWRVPELLHQYGIGVVLQRTHRLPTREDEDVDMPYRLPAILRNAGVQVAFAMDVFWNDRNLPFQAGTAVAHGMDYAAAIQALTQTPARMLGIEGRVGTLEAGKDATLFMTQGDVLDMRSSQLEAAFIQGRQISLHSRQTELYERFLQRE